MATLLHPGRLSPARQVPANIPRPEYVGKKQPTLGELDVKDAATIARMRVACTLAAQAARRACAGQAAHALRMDAISVRALPGKPG